MMKSEIWQELATAEFLKVYAESDAIYDEYFSRPQEDPQSRRPSN